MLIAFLLVVEWHFYSAKGHVPRLANQRMRIFQGPSSESGLARTFVLRHPTPKKSQGWLTNPTGPATIRPGAFQAAVCPSTWVHLARGSRHFL